MREFLDSRLEEPELVDHEGLRWLASMGARVRRAGLYGQLRALGDLQRPRGVLLLGPEARLIRAVLEPVCPVPMMAWQGARLPAWVGPLDMVAIVGTAGSADTVAAGAEAARRGATVLAAASENSELARAVAKPTSVLLRAEEGDPTASAVALLAVLGQLGLGPTVDVDLVAAALDLVAEGCSPLRDLSVNPGKVLAQQLAEHVPLIWGGTVLAHRAGRRLAEAVRRTSQVPALAADAAELLAVLSGVQPRDPFADPEDSPPQPLLVLLDADKATGYQAEQAGRLEAEALRTGVPVATMSSGEADLGRTTVEAYMTLLATGLYGAEYLRVGLGGMN